MGPIDGAGRLTRSPLLRLWMRLRAKARECVSCAGLKTREHLPFAPVAGVNFGVETWSSAVLGQGWDGRQEAPSQISRTSRSGHPGRRRNQIATTGSEECAKLWCPQRDTPGGGSGAGLLHSGDGLGGEGSSPVTTRYRSGIRWPLEGGDSRKCKRRSPINTTSAEVIPDARGIQYSPDGLQLASSNL